MSIFPGYYRLSYRFNNKLHSFYMFITKIECTYSPAISIYYAPPQNRAIESMMIISQSVEYILKPVGIFKLKNEVANLIKSTGIVAIADSAPVRSEPVISRTTANVEEGMETSSAPVERRSLVSPADASANLADLMMLAAESLRK